MNTRQSVLSATAAVLLASVLPALASNSVNGPGILGTDSPDDIRLIVQRAYAGTVHPTTSGNFRVEVGSSIPQLIGVNTVVVLNIYEVGIVGIFSGNTAQSSIYPERLVYKKLMTEFPKMPMASPTPLTRTSSIFWTNYDEVISKTGPLDGQYRAEAVVYAVPQRVVWNTGGAVEPPASYEVGASDVLFQAHSRLKLVPVTDVFGTLSVQSSVAISRRATPAQRAAIIARADAERKRAVDNIENYVLRQNAPTPGAPTKALWQYQKFTSGSSTPGVGVAGITISAGQTYTSSKTAVERDLKALAAAHTKTYNLPNGSVNIRVSNTVNLTAR